MKKLLSFSLALMLLFAAFHAFSEATLSEAMGVIEGDTYSNAYMGFGFRGEGWKYSSQEELDSTDKLAKAMMEEDSVKNLEELGTVTIMRATASNGFDNVGAEVTYLGTNALILEVLGMKAFYESQADGIKQNLNAASLTVNSFEISSITVDGRDMACYRIEYSFMGIIDIAAIQFSFLQNKYMITITATAENLEAAEQALLNYFWL
ncbi:MAG: hypothetical protein IKQ41_06505 [Clostridia bacterium]|nr:hypothetical protein [Clostridia bacterium]